MGEAGEGWKVRTWVVHRQHCEELCYTEEFRNGGRLNNRVRKETRRPPCKRLEKKRGEEGREIKWLDSSDTK